MKILQKEQKPNRQGVEKNLLENLILSKSYGLLTVDFLEPKTER